MLRKLFACKSQNLSRDVDWEPSRRHDLPTKEGSVLAGELKAFHFLWVFADWSLTRREWTLQAFAPVVTFCEKGVSVS